MTLPNFLIIGKAKAGTTALYAALKSHPQVFMSRVKEPRFFAFENNPPNFIGPRSKPFNQEVISQLDQYAALFSGAQDEIAIGEASPIYLHPDYAAISADNIKKHIPQARLIAILRHPVDRTYSAYNYRRQYEAEEETDFLKALDHENSPSRANWTPGHNYLRTSYCYESLKAYFDRFSREQLRVILYEDWNHKPIEELRLLFDFLHLDEHFMPDMTKRQNVTWMPRSQKVHNFLNYPHPLKTLFKHFFPEFVRRKLITLLNRQNRTPPPGLDPEVRRKLTLTFSEDIQKTQELIGRDLSHWLAG